MLTQFKRMTAEGYKRRTPEEIRESILTKQKELNPNFEKLDYDVQSNLIDTAVAKISEYENLLEAMFNAYSIDGSNEFFFKQMGEELGLRMKNTYNAQVTLLFKGLPGDIIPPFTRVTNVNKSVEFETQERKIIDTTGEVLVTAYGEAKSVVPAKSLNFLVTILSDGIVVTNPQASMEKIEQESFEEFKLRAQARLRSPRLGGRLYAESLIKSIDGVDPRLVSFGAIDYTRKYDPNNPEKSEEELENSTEQEKPEKQPENTEVSQATISKIRLVNAGETRPDINTLQSYCDAKWRLNQDLVNLELVHLYNKTGVNNYLYFNLRWYEIKFKKASQANSQYIVSINTNKNIQAVHFNDLPDTATDVLYYCNQPGNRIGFYFSKTEPCNIYLGREVNIVETNKPNIFNYIRIIGIEAVVGGGDEYQIALALYQAFFETQKLISKPSNKEKDRTVTVYLGLYNSKFPITFTRPKLLQLNLKLELTPLNKTLSATAVKQATEADLKQGINTLKVGRPVVVNQLNQFIQKGLGVIDVNSYEIKEYRWKYDIGEFEDNPENEDAPRLVWKDFDIDNKIPLIAFDTYCILIRYEVDIVGA